MIKFENVSKIFGTGGGVAEINLSIEKGEFVFLVGPTGSGKTTLFRLLIREMLPTQGSIMVGDFDIVKLPHKHLPNLRKKVGVVFQNLKLLADRTIFENVLLPLEIAGVSDAESKRKVEEVLTHVGILEHKDKFPIQLSGGELQRAAIARALTLGPEVLLADEPTGNLDAATSWEIVKLLENINMLGTTVLMATHNNEIVEKLAKRVITLEKGKMIGDKKHGHHKSEKEKTEKAKEKEEK